MPVILASLKTEAGGLQMPGQPGQFSEALPQKQKEDWAHGLVVENMPSMSQYGTGMWLSNRTLSQNPPVKV